MERGFLVECTENEDDSPKKKIRLSHAKTTAAQLRAVEKERDYYKSQAMKYHADTVHATLALNQTFEQISKEQHLRINAKVKQAAGLEHHVMETNEPSPNGTNKFILTQRTENKMTREMTSYASPSVGLDISDNEVKRRTGFPNLTGLLSYIFVVCDGDVALMLKRESSLTWFEEWFMHFEYKWGRTLIRYWDATKVYGPKRGTLIKIVASKYQLESKTRMTWPAYASHQEDLKLRKPKWNEKYSKDQRIVMWDMTNIEAFSFSDANIQRLTYSKYYNQNCFKGGVFVQLLGWMGVGELWPGAVSDSDYNRREGYLERQMNFANKDLVTVDGDRGKLSVLPFTNVYDKGYRAKMVAWKCGKQKVLQPEWAESDKRFRRDQTLLSASVATDRGGNERAVNVCKRAWFVSRGFLPNMSPKQLNDAWTTWSFQANFMFNPVL
jgi:hypothetical protein